MQILSSQPAPSSSSISRLSSPTFFNSKETETNQEEEQLSNQQIEGCAVEAAQPLDRPDAGSDTKKIRDPQQADRLLQQLAQTKARIFNSLDSVTTNLAQIHGRFDQLEPKALYLVLPVCLLSLSFSLYAMNAVHGKPNHQSMQALDNLLKQVNPPEQAGNNMLNRLDLIEAELNRMSGLLNQPGLKDLRPAFSVCAFSLFFSICAIGALWKKLNNQYIQNKNQSAQIEGLKNELSELKDERSRMDSKFSKQSEYIKGLQNKFTELETDLGEMVQSSQDEKSSIVNTLRGELDSRSEQIQEDLRGKFTALDSRFHPKDGSFEWARIIRKPTTLKEYGITDVVTTKELQAGFAVFSERFHPKDGQVDWNKIARKPTTISGYGITDFKGFIGRDGYQEFPSGLIMQWGFTITEMNGETKIKFPTEFPSSCLGIHGTHSGGGPAIVVELGGSRSKTEVTLRTFNHSGDTDRGWHIHWLAIGH